MEQKELNFNVKEIITRSPRLETVIMVERFIKEKSGEFRKTELFNNLPKKIMWGTFNVILKYLYENNKIGIDNEGFIIYIWNPELIKKFLNKKRY
ncbi:hypothetical protein GF386_05240 [Candidatus Pacearchaeota archaeon]|nr:hypothetical protein [Candidatus Pacearchaeota archaeon]